MFTDRQTQTKPERKNQHNDKENKTQIIIRHQSRYLRQQYTDIQTDTIDTDKHKLKHRQEQRQLTQTGRITPLQASDWHTPRAV